MSRAAETSNHDRHVLVVGGGVIGVACAYYLNREGFRVTVIDRGKIGAECSKGNCGLVCPSHVLPLAEPGAIGSTAASMLKPGGAFHVKPRFDASLWKWMANFAMRCNQNDMIESAQAIQPLLTSSLELYEQLVADEDVACEFHKQGLLFVYKSKNRLDAYDDTNDLLSEKFDEGAKKLNGSELSEFEPSLVSGLAGAWYFEHDAHLRPDRLMESWRSLLESRGVRFVEDHGLEKFDVAAARYPQPPQPEKRLPPICSLSRPVHAPRSWHRSLANESPSNRERVTRLPCLVPKNARAIQ